MNEGSGDEHRRDALARWLAGGGADALDLAAGEALDVVGLVDLDLRLRYVNWTAAGLTREGVMGIKVVDLTPPDYQQMAQTTYEGVLRTGRGARFEVLYEADGHVMMWDVRVAPIRTDGEIIGLITINADITEQRRAQADRDRFFSLSLDLLVVASPDGRFRRANPSFAKTLGYSEQEVAGATFIDLVHPDDQPQTQEAFDGLLEGRQVIDFENRYRCRDGGYRVLSWRCNLDPITGDLYGVARDITQHRATELQLRQAQKMEAVGQLAGGVAHDFNNLMQAILANTELAQLQAPPLAPAMQERLVDIEGAARRAADLTKQLLAFSRRQPLHPVATDLNELTRGLMTMLQRLIPEDVAVELIEGEGLSLVHADPNQLEQVIVNLCVNARDAMDAGGRVTIKTENVELGEPERGWARPGHYVLLTVADTGSGMSPEVRDRIFEPFFTTKAMHAGTGLGLSTVYGIVKQHDGVVDVSTEVGRGTTFSVYLPASEIPAVEARAKVARPSAPGHETILVAEDEESVRSAIVEMLGRGGYRTLVAENGIAALRLLREQGDVIDLVLLDVVMPELGGPETWEQMQRLRTDLKVLFCSGYADDRYLKRLPPNAGVLQKPFRGEELLRRVRDMLDA